MDDPISSGTDPAVHSCSIPARWLPRALAVSLLASAALAILALDPGAPFSATVKGLVMAAAALGALWLVRAGSEVRMEVSVGARTISFGSGRRFVELPLEEVEALDFDPVFSSGRLWLPAAVLVDRKERRWRIPAFIRQGPQLLEKILVACGRDDLRSWAEARRIGPRMARSRALVTVGYLAAGLLLVRAWLLAYR